MTKARCLEAGAPAPHVEALERAVPAINWGQLWQLIRKYGPGIVQEILVLLGKAPPAAPAPAPAT